MIQSWMNSKYISSYHRLIFINCSYLATVAVIFNASKALILYSERFYFCTIIHSDITWHKHLNKNMFKFKIQLFYDSNGILLAWLGLALGQHIHIYKYIFNGLITLVGSQMRMGNFISSPVWSIVALTKYSNQKSNISSSGCRLSFVRLNFFIREMLPMVDFRYQTGGFSLNIHSHAWQQLKLLILILRYTLVTQGYQSWHFCHLWQPSLKLLLIKKRDQLQSIELDIKSFRHEQFFGKSFNSLSIVYYFVITWIALLKSPARTEISKKVATSQ